MTSPTQKYRHLAAVSGAVPYHEWSPELERAVVLGSCSDERVWLALGQHVDAQSLRDPEARLLLAAARQLVARGLSPTVIGALQLVQAEVHERRMTGADLAKVDAWVGLVEDGRPVDPGTLLELAGPVLRQRSRSAILAEITRLNTLGEDIGPHAEALAATSAIGTVSIHAWSTLDTGVWALVQRLARGQRSATGLEELDAVMDGGVPRGTLTTWGGESGSGKTQALIGQLARNLRRGYRCVAFTAEIGVPAWLVRLIADLTGEVIEDVSRAGPKVQRQLDQVLGDTRLGVVSVTYMPPGTTVPSLARALDEAVRGDPRYRGSWDQLYVDYGDLMGGGSNDQNTYQEAKTIWTGLRGLATGVNGWVTTGSQLKDKAQRDGTCEGTYADSKHKGRVTDVGLIIEKAECEHDRLVRLAKFRDGVSGVVVGPFSPDWARGRFGPDYVVP